MKQKNIFCPIITSKDIGGREAHERRQTHPDLRRDISDSTSGYGPRTFEITFF